MSVLEKHTDLVESIIWENPEKEIQYRFTITEFRDVHYIGIREWYLGFEGDWLPSNNGVTLPYNLVSTNALYRAFVDILSQAEVLEEVKSYQPEEHYDTDSGNQEFPQDSI